MDKSDKFLNENGKKILKYPGIKKIYIRIYLCASKHGWVWLFSRKKYQKLTSEKQKLKEEKLYERNRESSISTGASYFHTWTLKTCK